MFDSINMFKTDNRIASSYFVYCEQDKKNCKIRKTIFGFWTVYRIIGTRNPNHVSETETFQNFFTFINLFSKI